MPEYTTFRAISRKTGGFPRYGVSAKYNLLTAHECMQAFIMCYQQILLGSERCIFYHNLMKVQEKRMGNEKNVEYFNLGGFKNLFR